LLFAVACTDAEPEQDGKIPGTLLGTYTVVGALVEDRCGAELLGAQNPWRFQVKLSRFQRDLYWLNGREAIVGDIEADARSFHFSTRVDVPVTPKLRGKAGCVVSRFDIADGTLAQDSEEQVSGFVAQLRFEYRAKDGADCVEIIGVSGGFNELPCRLAYDLAGARQP
jgi:hypothetical protein